MKEAVVVGTVVLILPLKLIVEAFKVEILVVRMIAAPLKMVDVPPPKLVSV